MKKLPSQLSNDELLKQLTERPKEEEREITSEDYHNDVLGFSTFFNLEAGEEYIAMKKLYRMYRQWSKEPVNVRIFTDTISTFLPRNLSGFYINKKALKLSALAHKVFVANKKRVQTKSPLQQKRFNSFISTYNIKKGDTPVPLWSLHHFYTEWAKYHKNHKMTLKTFQAFCKLSFEIKRDARNVSWIKLDKSIFEVFPRERVLSLHESKLSDLDKKAEDKKTKKQVSKPRSNSKPKN